MTTIPTIIHDAINEWKILSYSENDWINAFQGRLLRFRKGYKTYREDPYWEQLCEEKDMYMDEFFKISKTENLNDSWLYYDYKYMKDVLSDNSTLLEEIKWSNLGLDYLFGKDSTIWIGNKGAHTPCHMDTYGCNLVAQIRGRKLWILIPPEETEFLDPTRIPYEESSIYSSYNFYTPDSRLFKIKNAYRIILNPGDVLFVPKHWWHYVENMETAISINVWIPVDSDHESRLEEALVRYYVSNICQTLTEMEAKLLLNPNEYELLNAPFELDSLQIFLSASKKFDRERSASSKLSNLMECLKKKGVPVQSFPEKEITEFVKKRSEEFNYNLCAPVPMKKINDTEKISLSKTLINSYCNPKVLASIKDRLISGRK